MTDNVPQQITDKTGRVWIRNEDPAYKVYYETRGEPRLATEDHIRRSWGIHSTRH